MSRTLSPSTGRSDTYSCVRLILDAEESYYEAALDGYVRLLSMKYNRPYTPDNHLDKPSSPWTGPVI